MGSEESPGNMGLIDQTLALQWVKNHIHNFNGDPNKITIFGQDAGAVSVSLHLLSPISRDTFQYAIMQSGSALAPWVFESQVSAKNRAYDLAEMFDCTESHGIKGDDEVIACMRQQDAMEICAKMWNLLGIYNSITPNHVTIDDYFLKRHPATLLKEGDFKKSNILLGGCKDEGSYFLVYYMPQVFYANNNSKVDTDTYNDIVRELSRTKDKNIHDLINFEYNVPRDFESSREYPRYVLDDMLGDSQFLCPVVEFGDIYTQNHQTVYMYHYYHR